MMNRKVKERLRTIVYAAMYILTVLAVAVIIYAMARWGLPGGCSDVAEQMMRGGAIF